MAAPRCVVLAGLVLVLAQAGLAVTAQPHQHLADGPTAAATTEAGAVRTVLPGAPADACVTAPTMANCSHYMYPQTAAAADLRQLCHAMPFMGACSVALACNASGASPDIDPKAPGAANVSRNIPNVCDPFQLATTVCRLDTGMSKMGGACALRRVLQGWGGCVALLGWVPCVPARVLAAEDLNECGGSIAWHALRASRRHFTLALLLLRAHLQAATTSTPCVCKAARCAHSSSTIGVFLWSQCHRQQGQLPHPAFLHCGPAGPQLQDQGAHHPAAHSKAERTGARVQPAHGLQDHHHHQQQQQQQHILHSRVLQPSHGQRDTRPVLAWRPTHAAAAALSLQRAVLCCDFLFCAAQVRSICEEMTMDGCEKCMPSWEAGKTWADCNLLEVYSYLCYQMPGALLAGRTGAAVPAVPRQLLTAMAPSSPTRASCPPAPRRTAQR
jgi:hypothetical protein